MANEKLRSGPTERASGLADKIMGRASTNDAVSTIVAGVRATDDDRTDEEGPQSKRVIKAQSETDEEETEDFDADDSDDDDGDQLNTDEDDEEAEEASEDDNEDADQEDEDQDDDEDDYEEVAYADDDVFEIPVDGETREVTLRELLDSYSGEGAIQKRLKEATEDRRAAKAERDAAVQQIEEHRTNLLRTIQALDEALFMPLVQKPPAALRTKNMNEYLLQQDAYEEDQKRIVQSRATMTKFFHDQQAAQAEIRQKYREEQQALLVEKMPELRDPRKAPVVQQDILLAARHYGFTAEQVAQVDNHGLFLMARDAARWLNLQKLKKNGKSSVTSNGAKRKKRLRSGSGKNGVAAAKIRAMASDKQKKVAETRARASGKVEDVTNLLISKARTREGTQHGRRR